MDFGEIGAAVADAIAGSWPYFGPIVGALIGFAFASWLESRRAARAYRWQRRDAKVLRLREAFLPLILSTWGYQSAANEMTWGFENETDQQKKDRINAMVAESTKGLNEARARLAIEVDAKPFAEKFHELYVAFKDYAYLMAEVAKGNTPQPVLAAKQKVNALADELESMIRQKLAELERAN
ncbi:MAG: hypothetical protein ACRDM0_00350 [Thermoleophilaceae bacterium]